jgi:formylglycine-generating enzyme required for sulfatase activity
MTAAAIQVFFSYSHRDEDLRDELAKSLKLLERQGIIQSWHDRRISAGTEWAKQIDGNLNSADIILLLVSANFLDSDYCYDLEMKRAMARHEAKEARVIPIILKPCRWQRADFGGLQALPKDGNPVTNWKTHDDAFVNIVEGIEQVAEELKQKKAGGRGQEAEGKGNGIITQPFDFETATISVQSGKVNIQRRPGRAQQFIENLPNGITLEMVAIPAGIFYMGSPGSEEGRLDRESPQHLVTVPPFYMGKYPVTQAQWFVVASFLPKIELELNPNPASFKGVNLPVECVSWYDAVEFCRRLSRATGKEYRLPSEAEWEYACRGGTTTPFYCGETITTDLANYNGNYPYGAGVKGQYRERTTEVGSFPANPFGLYDMHGNVWQWCADTWHKNYQGAPIDGSAWLEGGNDSYSPLRGGSWYVSPQVCRSAFRFSNGRGYNYFDIGFRVVCVSGRT